MSELRVEHSKFEKALCRPVDVMVGCWEDLKRLISFLVGDGGGFGFLEGFMRQRSSLELYIIGRLGSQTKGILLS